MAHDERQTDAERDATNEREAPEVVLARSELDAEAREAVEALLVRVREAEDRVLRIEAEADNRRKRLEREQADAIRFANEALVARLLPAFDNLEVCAQGAACASTGQLLDALGMTLGELREAFGSIGIELFSAASGEAFDPRIHEAAVRDTESELPRNTVVRALQDGVRYHGRVMRPAKVVVAAGRA